MEYNISDKFWRKNLMKNLLFAWICINKCLADAIDLTCTSNAPRIAINSTDDLYLTSYLGDDNTNPSVTVTFNLHAYTGTSFVLPGTTLAGDAASGYSARHSLPSDSGSARIGAFNCQTVLDDVANNIVIIILSAHADIVPASQTITASIGGTIDLETTSNTDPPPKLDWRKNGLVLTGQANNQFKLSITNAAASDAGIYEVYVNKRRAAGQGAIIRLIIRDCPEAKWGPPSCEGDCQVCYNGGICDDQSGLCACAPGFSGRNCQNVHGRNHFGQDGSLQCSSDGDRHDNGCQGQLLCLPDPYGCSCASGYTGIDCQEECTEGTYGANCKGTCHCTDGGSVCLKDTGECETGGCQMGWRGVNCQVPDPCPESYVGGLCQLRCNCESTQTCVAESGVAKCYSCNTALTSAPTDIISASLSPTSAKFSWSPVQCSGTEVDLNLYEYKLISMTDTEDVVTGETGITEVTITGLTPCTQYAFSVAGKTSQGTVYSAELDITTEAVAPTDAPLPVSVTAVSANSVDLTWTLYMVTSPCDNPLAEFQAYHYKIVNLADPSEIYEGETTDISVTVRGLNSCVDYNVMLAVSNGVGRGPYNEGVAVRTNLSVPTTIRGLSLPSEIDPNYLPISWRPPSSSCLATSYIIDLETNYRDQCQVSDHSIRIETTNTSVVLTNLAGFSTHSLTITTVNSAGTGSAISAIFSTGEAVPRFAPSNISMTSATSTSISISWDPIPCGQQGGQIKKYLYKLINPLDDSIQEQGETALTSVTVTGLSPCMVYAIRIAAMTNIGVGPYSDGYNASTADGAAPSAVNSITVTGQSNTTLLVSWTAPSIGCIISEYVIVYTLTNRDQCQTEDNITEMVVSNDTLEVILMGLWPYSNYTVSVKGRNSEGDGPIVSTVWQTAGGVPTGVGNLMVTGESSTELRLSWEAPESFCMATSYLVQYQITYVDQCNSIDVQPANYGVMFQTSTIISELIPYTNYTVYIMARNEAGDGPTVEALATTLERAPVAGPSNLQLTVSTTDSLSLVWDEPLCGNRGGKITHYTYTLFNTVTFDIVLMDTTDKSATITGLEPCTTYVFTANAYNSAGAGPNVSREVSTVVIAPSIVQHLTATPQPYRDVELSWQPPMGSCQPNIYRIEYQLMNLDQCLAENGTKSIQGVSRGTSSTITGLQWHSTYMLFVTGINTASESPEGLVVTTTAESAPTSAPLNVSTSNLGNLEMVITWQPPPCGSRNGPITSYTYKLIAQSNQAEKIGSTPALEVVVSNLTLLEEYSVVVSAATSVGSGPFSAPVSHTIEDVATPSPPTVDPTPSSNMTTTTPTSTPSENVTTTLTSSNGTIPPVSMTTPSSNMTTPTGGNYTTGTPIEGTTLTPSGPGNMTSPSGNVTVVPPEVTTQSSNVSTMATPIATSPSVNVTSAPPVMPTSSDNFTTPLYVTSPGGNYTIEPATGVTTPSGNATGAPTVSSSPSGNVTVSPPDVTTPGGTNATSPTPIATSGTPDVSTPDGTNATSSTPIATSGTPDITTPGGPNATSPTPIVTSGTPDVTTPGGTNATSPTPIATSGTPIATSTISPGIPSPPTDITFPSATINSILVEWSPPDATDSPITTYEILYWKTSDGDESAIGIPVTGDFKDGVVFTYNITDLDMYTGYSFKMRATSLAGDGLWSDVLTTQTQGDLKPSDLSLVNKTQTMLRFKWGPPTGIGKEVEAYKVDYRAITKPYDLDFQPAGLFKTHISDASCTNCQTEIKDLEPSTQYEVRVTATIDSLYTRFASLEAFTSVASGFAPPVAPVLNVDKSTKSQVAIGLPEPVPEPESKYISGFQIGVKKSQTRNKRADTPIFGNGTSNAYVAGEVNRSDKEFTVGDGKTYGGYVNPPLTEGQEYDIYVAVVSRTSDEDPSIVWGEPLSVIAGQYKPKSAPTTSDDGFFTTTWIAVICGIGLLVIIIIIIFILVVSQHCKKRKESQSIMFESGRPSRSLDAFPVDEGDIDSKPVTSIISLKPIDNSIKSNGLDSPIMTTFSSLPRHANGSNGSHANGSHVNGSALPGIIDDELPTPGLIAVRDLPLYVQKKKADPRKGFHLEYKMLPDGKQHDWSDSMKVPNQSKNRYSNIVPYNHSRVKLQPQDDDAHSDYINACYINNYKQERRYISSQGPKDSTIGDFWRMIWEHKATKVIMLTNCVETGKKKCALYWPDLAKGQTAKYGPLTVIPVSLEEYLDYTVRAFHISKLGDDTVHAVKQFHFTSWPDMGVPQYPTQLLNFRKATRDYDADSSALTIVHCSAGVGRSGAYIAIDNILDQASDHGGVDIYKYVSEMRQQRCKMVQTSEQYQFIYEAILEAVLTKETSIVAADFEKTYASIKDGKSGSTKLSSLEEQFQLLDYLTTKPTIGSCKAAKRKENMDKNRFNDRLPSDRVRPFLVTPSPMPSTDYINAALIPGFRKKNQYIATQMPLPHTMADLWRLVYDYKATAIVMLNVMDPNDQTYGRYWPEHGSNIYGGNLAVDFESSSKVSESILVRTYKMYSISSEDVPSDTRTVHQYQFLDWYDQKGVPADSHEALLALVTMVDQWQKKSGGGPVIVQCLDGVGCSGVYCALSTILQRLEESLVVDVFQTVKGLRMVIPNMVETPTQYQFLYDAVQHHISQAGPSAL